VMVLVTDAPQDSKIVGRRMVESDGGAFLNFALSRSPSKEFGEGRGEDAELEVEATGSTSRSSSRSSSSSSAGGGGQRTNARILWGLEESVSGDEADAGDDDDEGGLLRSDRVLKKTFKLDTSQDKVEDGSGVLLNSIASSSPLDEATPERDTMLERSLSDSGEPLSQSPSVETCITRPSRSAAARGGTGCWRRRCITRCEMRAGRTCRLP
jgi:hypothetical protein